jgi:hypothetical protein
MSTSSPPHFAFAAWCLQGRRLVAQRPRTFLAGAFAGVLLVYLAPVPLTAVHSWPCVYALVMGWLCRRLLPLGPQAPVRLPWVRLLLVGAFASLPFAILAGLLMLVGAGEGKGPVFFFMLMLWGMARVGPEWFLWLSSLPAAAVSLVCVIAIGFAPAFVAVAGHGVRRAVSASVRTWCRHPLAAGATVVSALLLLAVFFLAGGLLLRVNVLAGLAGGFVYGFVCTLAGAAIGVAASAAALAQAPAVVPQTRVRQGS